MEEKILKLIAREINKPVEKIDKEDILHEDLGFDPLNMVGLQMAILDEFGVDVPDDKMSEFVEVQDVIDYIKKESK